MAQEDTLDNLVQELRRGSIVLAVLSQLQEEQYGYSILKLLTERGLEVDQGTLYPLLRRLESQELLDSRWRLEDNRQRRYYILNQKGHSILIQMKDEWAQIVATLEPFLAKVVKGKAHDNGQH